jgi:hypothetical protein
MGARRVVATIAVLIAATSGCKKSSPPANTCNTDADCAAPGTGCDTALHQCICKRDEACPMGQFCNHVGVCQGIAGCTANADCTKKNQYCDIASGMCLDGAAMQIGSRCGLATHCPSGSICMDGACQDGCFGDGDCILGDVCLKTMSSTVGMCATGNGVCSDDTFCKFGESCSASTVPATCKRDFRGPYCRGCSQRTTANPEPCDAPQNFCLINNLEIGGHLEYCGVDCSLGQACPNGYICDGVVILTQDVCTNQAECQCDRTKGIRYATATCTVAIACDPHKPDGTPDPNAPSCIIPAEPSCNTPQMTRTASCVVARGLTVGACTCRIDSDCGPGGSCVDGRCCTGGVPHPTRMCEGGEGNISGFCTCDRDSDCPRDVCDGSRSACVITGLPCTPGMDDCPAIPCVMGGCVIGKNCAPEDGLNCTILSKGG